MQQYDNEVFRTLCEALSGRGVPASFACASQLENGIFRHMQALAENERVLPALYDALAVHYGATVAKPIRAVCAVQKETNRRRNLEIRNALLELGEAAAADGFSFAALKGAAWIIEDEQGAAAWRTMLDMDVLVETHRFDAIPPFLQRLGYIRLSNSRRYDMNFHHAPYARLNGPTTVEVHRHLGWQHRLLAPELLFENARVIANGVLLPAPWCRAFHAVVHWQLQDFGGARATVGLKDVLEVARFLARPDVDWARIAQHARSVGAMRACEAAVALAGELLGARCPPEIPVGPFGRRHVALALARKNSQWRSWLAREKWRAGTLWRCEKLAYRHAIKGAAPARIRAAVWTGRLLRLPHLCVRTIGIAARAAGMLLSERSQRKHFARAR
jgi:hypothetical protein